MLGAWCDVLGERCLVRCEMCLVLILGAYRSDCWAPLIRHTFKPRPKKLRTAINRRENPPAPHILLRYIEFNEIRTGSSAFVPQFCEHLFRSCCR